MARAFTPETLVYDFKAAGDPQIAPDGERVLYTLAQLNREAKKPSAQLWLCRPRRRNAAPTHAFRRREWRRSLVARRQAHRLRL